MKNNITCTTTNCNHRVAAILRTLEQCFFFARYKACTRTIRYCKH